MCVCVLARAIWYAIYVKCPRRFLQTQHCHILRELRIIGGQKLTAQIYYLSRRLTIKANRTVCGLWNVGVRDPMYTYHTFANNFSVCNVFRIRELR